MYTLLRRAREVHLNVFGELWLLWSVKEKQKPAGGVRVAMNLRWIDGHYILVE